MHVLKSILATGLVLGWTGSQVGLAEPLVAQWELGPTGTKASLRAIAAPSSEVLWASGSAGTVIRSEDGGSSWTDCSPSGLADVEFRALSAWDRSTACVASAGAPAVLMRTDDGGQTWERVYHHTSPQAFFDGLKFWDDRRGIAISDPVAGAWLVIQSSDGGRSWEQIAVDKLPQNLAGEAVFAASNSAILVGPDGAVWFGTGGSERASSRIHYRSGWAEPWRSAECPLASSAAAGVFSLARSGERIVAVGGDYRPMAATQANAAWSGDGGVTWKLSAVPPTAYRSAVAELPAGWLELVPARAGFIATGPTGTDYSEDGDTWNSLSHVGFHALATTENEVFAVGSDGRFARLTTTGLAVEADR